MHVKLMVPHVYCVMNNDNVGTHSVRASLTPESYWCICIRMLCPGTEKLLSSLATLNGKVEVCLLESSTRSVDHYCGAVLRSEDFQSRW